MRTKKIVRIYDKGYDSKLNKYFVIAMFIEFGVTKYDRIFFSNEGDIENLSTGDMI